MKEQLRQRTDPFDFSLECSKNLFALLNRIYTLDNNSTSLKARNMTTIYVHAKTARVSFIMMALIF